jgi:hypothetical protein
VASDSDRTSEVVERACGTKEQALWPLPSGHGKGNGKGQGPGKGQGKGQGQGRGQGQGKGQGQPVCVFTADPSERFRAEHGAHIVAADGGCKPVMVPDPAGGRSTEKLGCAIPYNHVLDYRDDPELNKTPPPQRMMTVLLDAVEDLYLLSFTDVYVAQMSSHFSTVAALLIWARSGAADVSNVLYLDSQLGVSGENECAYLLRPVDADVRTLLSFLASLLSLLSLLTPSPSSHQTPHPSHPCHHPYLLID